MKYVYLLGGALLLGILVLLVRYWLIRQVDRRISGYQNDLLNRHVEEVEQQLESAERIQVMLADKEQVKRILKEERVTLRGAYLMMMYLNSRDGLDFLEV